ncbi:MAG TPA: hypothetical protein VHM92_07725 [Allosphingosinicella sp.]|nr:hypothetical protein [Allosphingosinicella sp.]
MAAFRAVSISQKAIGMSGSPPLQCWFGPTVEQTGGAVAASAPTGLGGSPAWCAPGSGSGSNGRRLGSRPWRAQTIMSSFAPVRRQSRPIAAERPAFCRAIASSALGG